MEAREERLLIRRTLDGDRAAAEALVKAHQGPLYAYMLRMSGKPEVAEDVTQEAFVRALTHLARYDEKFRFSTWLFTIAKRLHVNACQRLAPTYDSEVAGIVSDQRRAAQSAGKGGWVGATEDEDLTPGAHASKGAADDLQRAINALSADQREVIVLFYQLSWSVEQIGQYLDIPVGTVKSHLFRARARLRALLAQQPAIEAWLSEEVA